MSPDLLGVAGTRYRYTAAQPLAGKWRTEQGGRLTTWAKMSAYGYATWPNLVRAKAVPGLFDAMHKVVLKGQRQDHVPILSCEGWVNHPDAFAKALAEWGNPPIDVVVFLRPVVDWMNAAFWQWGVWSNLQLDGWMERSNLPYSFADDIAAWKKIPNVRVIVRSQRPDVVSKFSDIYGVPLQAERHNNMASSPALVGFLMRNRTYRPNGHEAASEFVVQRWCPSIPSEKLWAVALRHIRKLRKVNAHTVAVLRETLREEDLEDLMTDPRWLDETPYHDDVLNGVTRLNDPSLCDDLYDSLCQGALAACESAKLPVPDLPPPLSGEAIVQDWDRISVSVLEVLLDADAKVRGQVVPRWQRRVLSYLHKAGKF